MPEIGQRVGPWTLLEQIGEGGNGTVWKALRGEDEPVAVKVLNTRRPASEPFRRFRDEVKVLQSLAGEPGILPLLDSELPDSPTRERPAWLAMPIAVPILDALVSPSPLENVVAAVAEIAGTLARLAERGISHRDIKPENLYSYLGKFVVGDFGLVSFPSKDAITTDERSVGPRNYLPPEMMWSPHSADGKPVDVYLLAKTLWVLATGRKGPPPGNQVVESKDSLAALLGHARARPLDWLIERGTMLDPSDRVTMERVAAELNAWLRPQEVNTPVPDLDAIGERYQAQVADRERRERRRRRWEEEARRLLTTWAESLAAIAEAAKQFGATFRRADNNPIMSESGPAAASEAAAILVFREGRCISVAPPGDVNPLVRIGVGVWLVDDGTLILTAGCRLRTAGERHEVLWLDERQTHIESSEVRHHIAQLDNALTAAVPAALDRYTGAVEAARTEADPLRRLDLPASISAIVVWLNEQSKDACEGFDSVDPVEVQTRFALTDEQLLKAIQEIEPRGWIGVHRAASGGHVTGIASLTLLPTLFIDTDLYLKGWDPRRDAEHIARLALEEPDGCVVLRGLADKLGWEARRMNPAIYLLVLAGAVDPSPRSSGAHPFTYDDFTATAQARHFRMR